MRRRNFIHNAALALAGASASCSVLRGVRDMAAKDGINVLMISVDDLNGWIEPLAREIVAKTPALDRLAQMGVCFTKAYCAAPACGPSRAAVLTGLPPTTTGCYLNRDKWTELVPDAVTLPRALKESSYWTAGFGKLFHADARNDDVAAWVERDYRQPSPQPDNMPLNGLQRRASFDWGPIDVPVEAMDDHQQVNRAIATMRSPRQAPFFVACGIYRPHLPWYVPQPFFDLYPPAEIVLPTVLEHDLDDIPPFGRSLAQTGEHKAVVEAGQWQDAVRAYLASISYADFEIGRLLDGLEASGKLDRTLIVLWSDHGWHLGPKNHWRKFALWEEATRSVLMFAGPGIAAGQLCHRTVSLLDIYPTLANYLEFPLPSEAIAGRSLLPLLSSPESDWPYPARSTFIRGNHSIRSEDYRYTRYSDGGEELYDHRVDPNEWVNLANQPELREVISELSTWLPQTEAPANSTYLHRETAWLEAPSQRRYLNPNVETYIG